MKTLFASSLVLGLFACSFAAAAPSKGAEVRQFRRGLKFGKNADFSFSVDESKPVKLSISLPVGWVEVSPSSDNTIHVVATALSDTPTTLIETETKDMSHLTFGIKADGQDHEGQETPIIAGLGEKPVILGLTEINAFTNFPQFPGTARFKIEVPNSILRNLEIRVGTGFVDVHSFKPVLSAADRAMSVEVKEKGDIRMVGNYAPGGFLLTSNGAKTTLIANQGRTLIKTRAEVFARRNTGKLAILLPKEYRGFGNIKVFEHEGEASATWIRDAADEFLPESFDLDASIKATTMSWVPDNANTIVDCDKRLRNDIFGFGKK